MFRGLRTRIALAIFRWLLTAEAIALLDEEMARGLDYTNSMRPDAR